MNAFRSTRLCLPGVVALLLSLQVAAAPRALTLAWEGSTLTAMNPDQHILWKVHNLKGQALTYHTEGEEVVLSDGQRLRLTDGSFIGKDSQPAATVTTAEATFTESPIQTVYYSEGQNLDNHMASDGTYTIFQREYSDKPNGYVYQSDSVSGSWSEPVLLPQTLGNPIMSHRVVGPDGKLAVLIRTIGEGPYDLEVLLYDPQTGWSGPELADSRDEFYQYFQGAFDANGDLHVVAGDYFAFALKRDHQTGAWQETPLDTLREAGNLFYMMNVVAAPDGETLYASALTKNPSPALRQPGVLRTWVYELATGVWADTSHQVRHISPYLTGHVTNDLTLKMAQDPSGEVALLVPHQPLWQWPGQKVDLLGVRAYGGRWEESTRIDRIDDDSDAMYYYLYAVNDLNAQRFLGTYFHVDLDTMESTPVLYRIDEAGQWFSSSPGTYTATGVNYIRENRARVAGLQDGRILMLFDLQNYDDAAFVLLDTGGVWSDLIETPHYMFGVSDVWDSLYSDGHGAIGHIWFDWGEEDDPGSPVFSQWLYP